MTKLRGSKIAYIPQEPMSNLDPPFTHRQPADRADADLPGISARTRPRSGRSVCSPGSGIPDPKRTFAAYPHQISGGMAQRVLIAGAVSCDPDLLIADEPTTALDVTVQAEVLDLLRDLQTELHMGVLLVTHNFGVVADLCDRVSVMQAGRIVETGPARSIFADPQHEYTQSLFDAILEDSKPRRRPRAARRPPTTQPADEGGAPMSKRRPAPTQPLLDVDNLVVEYPATGLRQEAVPRPARASPSTSVPGETVGLVGESGSGKTTLGRAVLGLAPVTGGEIRFDGRDISHLPAQGAPRAVAPTSGRLPGPLHVAQPGDDHRADPDRAADRSQGARRPRPPSGSRSCSTRSTCRPTPAAGCRASSPAASGSGSRSRGRSRSRPKLIVCDEPVSALDLSTQARVLALFLEIQERTGVAYLFVSHDLDVVRHLSHRVAVMFHGEIVEWGDGAQVTSEPQHPYTQRLFLASPVPDPERQAQRRADRKKLADTPEGPRSRGEGGCREEGPAVRFGAAYYAEYQRTPRLKADFDLMAEAGFSVIRVGESVWSTWEPEDGRLRPRLARAGARRGPRARHRRDPRHADLRRSRCGSSAATRRSRAISATGQPIGWGARQEMDFTHAAYLFHAERIIRAVVTPLPRAPGDHRLPGRQRARPAAAPQRRASSSGSSTGCATATARSSGSTRSGASSTGRTGSRPGPTCGAPTATSSRSTTWPGAGSRPSSSPTSSAGRPTSSASWPTPRTS